MLITAKVYENNFPLTRMSRRGIRDKNWVTNEVKKASKLKNALYKKWIITRDQTDNVKYKQYKKEFNKISKEAENSYYKVVFKELSDNAKKIWAQINKICSFKKKQKNVNLNIEKLIIEGNVITVPSEIAHELNNFFSTVGENLGKNIPHTNGEYEQYMDPSIRQSFYCTDITETEIITELQMLARKKELILNPITMPLYPNHHILLLSRLSTFTICH